MSAGVLRQQLARRLVGEVKLRPAGTRGFAADPHGAPKKNFWETSNVADWKTEHTVLLILSGWGIAIKGALTYFGK